MMVARSISMVLGIIVLFVSTGFEVTPLEDDMPRELAELIEIYDPYAEKWQIQDVRDDWNPQKELGH